MTERETIERVLAEQEAAAPDDGQDPIVASGLSALSVESDLGDVASCLERLRSLIDGTNLLERRVLRNRAIAELKRAKVPDPSGLVDAALGGNKHADSVDARAGRAVVLSRPDPWPEAVDGAGLLAELAQTFAHYAALPAGGATALALWTVHAHAFDAAHVAPLMVLQSAEKRSGKTTTLTVLGALVPAPLPISSVSPAALFRAIERDQPTLLLDEADSVFAGNDELRTLLNAGHTEGQAVVLRTVGEQYEPRAFSTWCPKAVALIGKLPGTLADRSVTLQMARRLPTEHIARLRLDRLGALEPLRRRAARWAGDQLGTLREADPAVPEELHDRAQDNWRTLLAIADTAGGVWPDRARKAARVLSAADKDTASARELLLGDLRWLFADRDAQRLTSVDIVEALGAREDRPWPEWKQGRPLTTRQLAKLLEPLGVRPKVLRIDGERRGRGYDLVDLLPVFARYLPPIRDTRDSPATVGRNPESRSVTGGSVVTDAKTGNPKQNGPCHGVTDGKGDVGQMDRNSPLERHVRSVIVGRPDLDFDGLLATVPFGDQRGAAPVLSKLFAELRPECRP